MARRFHFPLETLLRVRELREREAKRKVAAQHAEIARLDQLNQATQQEIFAQQAALLQEQQQGHLSASGLVRGRAWIVHLRNAIAQREAQRLEMVKTLEQLQAEFRAARQQTRIIEKLRERRWAEYLRDRNRREQAAAEELAQQLHSYGRAAPPTIAPGSPTPPGRNVAARRAPTRSHAGPAPAGSDSP